jgi:hypothetical protein
MLAICPPHRQCINSVPLVYRSHRQDPTVLRVVDLIHPPHFLDFTCDCPHPSTVTLIFATTSPLPLPFRLHPITICPPCVRQSPPSVRLGAFISACCVASSLDCFFFCIIHLGYYPQRMHYSAKHALVTLTAGSIHDSTLMPRLWHSDHTPPYAGATMFSPALI